ncbi:Type VII secretion protein EccB OS=Streptomyces glaucescens OX=1907 GN=SGLAU_24605 PE=3 SV=1 [Streptomyces glaucescens]
MLAEKEWAKTEGRNKLSGGDLMYVVGPDGKSQYVVDSRGWAYPLKDPDDKELLKALDTQSRAPQRVSQDWLDTLHKGDPLEIPAIDGVPGDAANASDSLGEYDKVGMVIKAYDGTRMQYYVVLPGEVARISEFTATLLLNSGKLVAVGQTGEAQQVSPGAVVESTTFLGDKKWPATSPGRSTTAPAPPAAATPSATCCAR